MRCATKTTILAVTGLLLGVGAEGVVPDAPTQYRGIVERNVFNIHPPVASTQTMETKKPDIPKITLNGIDTLLGRKEVTLTIPGAKPGAPAKTLILVEGQAQDEVEIKQIDEKAAIVKVVNHGEEQTLDFEHNGTKPSGPAPAMTVPAGFPPPMPPAAQPPPNVQSPSIIRSLRTLPVRSPGDGL